jgi:predicted GIY-YIG superfamily endonuclease
MAPVFWTYVLQNPAGKFYIGHTDDLKRRLSEHNTPVPGEGKYTHKHGPWAVVWSETHPTRSDAMKREKQIKAMKSARWIREHLLSGSASTQAVNPDATAS